MVIAKYGIVLGKNSTLFLQYMKTSFPQKQSIYGIKYLKYGLCSDKRVILYKHGLR